MVNPEHIGLLRQGARAWNTWRGPGDYVNVDLKGVNLERMSLQGVNLEGVSLKGARMAGRPVAH